MASDIPPGTPYVAVANADEIDFFDPTTGQPLAKRQLAADWLKSGEARASGQDPAGNAGTFTARRVLPTSGDKTYSFDGDLRRIAGLDAYNSGDTVPAYLDLTTGTVADIVAPTDHSGFSSVPIVDYIDAVYNPQNEDLWSVRADDPAYKQGADGSHYTVTGPPDTNQQYTYHGNPNPSIDLGFLPGSAQPSVFIDGGTFQPSPPSAPHPSDTSTGEQYLDYKSLGDTPFSVRNVRRPDSGKPGGAFIAYPPNSSEAKLFVWSGSGAPKQIASVAMVDDPSNADIEVIRYKDR